MKKSLDIKPILIFCQKNRNNLLLVGVILACLITFFYLIIPQVLSFGDLQKQKQTEEEKLTVLNNNLNYLSSVDDNSLDNQYKITTNALPKQKDFAAVLNAVSQAAGKSSVSLGDFEFLVGDISKATVVKGHSFLELNLNFTGDLQGLMRFINEVNQTAPLAEITSIEASDKSFMLSINFYYQVVPPVNLKSESPIKPVDANGQRIIKQISKWNNLQGDSDLIFPEATTSGTFSSGPFQ